jgi:hypothetical protein
LHHIFLLLILYQLLCRSASGHFWTNRTVRAWPPRVEYQNEQFRRLSHPMRRGHHVPDLLWIALNFATCHCCKEY